MVATTDLYVALGSRACISALVKTLEPKISPGASPATKLMAGGMYASTLLIACRRTAFPLNGVPIAEGGQRSTTFPLREGGPPHPRNLRFRTCYARVNGALQALRK